MFNEDFITQVLCEHPLTKTKIFSITDEISRDHHPPSPLPLSEGNTSLVCILPDFSLCLHMQRALWKCIDAFGFLITVLTHCHTFLKLLHLGHVCHGSHHPLKGTAQQTWQGVSAHRECALDHLGSSRMGQDGVWWVRAGALQPAQALPPRPSPFLSRSLCFLFLGWKAKEPAL